MSIIKQIVLLKKLNNLSYYKQTLSGNTSIMIPKFHILMLKIKLHLELTLTDSAGSFDTYSIFNFILFSTDD